MRFHLPQILYFMVALNTLKLIITTSEKKLSIMILQFAFCIPPIKLQMSLQKAFHLIDSSYFKTSDLSASGQWAWGGVIAKAHLWINLWCSQPNLEISVVHFCDTYVYMLLPLLRDLCQLTTCAQVTQLLHAYLFVDIVTLFERSLPINKCVHSYYITFEYRVIRQCKKEWKMHSHL